MARRSCPILNASDYRLGLAAQLEAVDQLLVAARIDFLDVVELTAALRDQKEKAAAAADILLVGLHMLGQRIDALSQKGDLHFRRAGVLGGSRVFLDDRGFLVLHLRHRILL